MGAVLSLVIGFFAGNAGPGAASNKYAVSSDTADCVLDMSFGGNQPDPQPQTFFYSDVQPLTRDTLNWVREHVFNPTSVDTVVLNAATSTTDVVVYDEDYSAFCGAVWHPMVDQNGQSTIGKAVCVGLTTAGTCEKHELRTDLSWWADPAVTAPDERGHLCHEIGHTLGLDHSNPSSCLYYARDVNAANPPLLHDHDMWMINGGPRRLSSQEDAEWYMPASFGEGGFMSSPSGAFRLFLQTDGNLVLYDSAWVPRWATGKNNPWNNWVYMQGDGNFVQYASDGFGTWPVCSTRTAGHPRSEIKLQDDGNLIVYDTLDRVWWSTFSGGLCL